MCEVFYKLLLAYDGTDFAGWQIQPGKRTVQGQLEETLTRLCHSRVVVIGSGRTDAGVHARGQVATARVMNWRAGTDSLHRALQANLPTDISVLKCSIAEPGFHPINHAIGKRYEYLMRWSQPIDPFARRLFWQLPYQLDVDAMRRAAECLIGRHDFRSFQSAGSDKKTSIREIRHVHITSKKVYVPGGVGEDYLVEVQADGFLYNMVRIIVGSLVEIGRGKQPIRWMAEALQACDRKVAGVTAPPQGLCLVHVDYPERIEKKRLTSTVGSSRE